MEFHVHLEAAGIDAAEIERRLQDIDPAGIADVDAASGQLRLSANLSSGEVVSLLQAAGYKVDPSQVEIQPSVCCGGCSG